MKIEVLERSPKRISVVLHGVSVVIANSIRRVAITEVPTLAVEHVFIYKNTSVLDDEVLAHRLGLIPLTTDLDKFTPNDECECKSEFGCPKCSVTLYLEAKAEDEVKTIYSSDLRSEDESVKPVSLDIPIVKLAPGQEVSLEMRAVMGRGRVHAKWQPLSVAVVRGIPIFKLNESLCNGCGECVKACPKKILESIDGKPKLTSRYECTTCKLCAEACPTKAIGVEIDEGSSILTLESVGQIPPETILDKAIEILIGKIKEFRVSIGGVASSEA